MESKEADFHISSFFAGAVWDIPQSLSLPIKLLKKSAELGLFAHLSGHPYIRFCVFPFHSIIYGGLRNHYSRRDIRCDPALA